MEMTQETPVYAPDSYVSYGSYGVCRVIGQETCTLHDDPPEIYYKLRPIDGSNSVYYVPVGRLRPLLTRAEIHRLIDDMAAPQEDNWCSDNRQRRGLFQDILHSDDYRQIIRMLHALYQQQQRKHSTGHKLGAADEAAMHAGEQRMYQEFGIVLGIPPEAVHDYITQRLTQHT